MLQLHVKSKPHKKRYVLSRVDLIPARLRELKEVPYTLAEANAAGGCGTSDFYQNKIAQTTLLNQ